MLYYSMNVYVVLFLIKYNLPDLKNLQTLAPSILTALRSRG